MVQLSNFKNTRWWLTAILDIQQESPANARVTRDSSACMKTPMVENSSAGNPYKTKHHVDRQSDCEVMAIFVHPRWPQASILDF